MISPSTGFSSWWHEEFYRELQRQPGHRISSVSRCLVTGCEKFVWTVKTEYTLYSTKYLQYSCKFKQHNTIFLTNNISLTTRSHRILKLTFSTPPPSKSHQHLSPGFPLQLRDICEVAPVHTWLPNILCHLLQADDCKYWCLQIRRLRWSNYVTTRYFINNQILFVKCILLSKLPVLLFSKEKYLSFPIELARSINTQ